MKQHQFIRAYRVMQKLRDMELPIQTAMNVRVFMKKLSPIFDCYADMELSIIRKYGGDVRPDGTILFDDPANSKEAKRELTDLANTDAEKIEPIHISIGDMGENKISASDVDALEGIVVFE